MSSHIEVRALVVFAALALSGCGAPSEAPSAQSPPQMRLDADLAPLFARLAELENAAADRSTPELALQARWARNDGLRALYCDWANAVRSGEPAREFERRRIAVSLEGLTGHALARKQEGLALECTVGSFERKVEDVNLGEGEATVRVRIKNTTPLAEGVVVGGQYTERRERGESYRYTLVNEEGVWNISKIERQDFWIRTWVNLTPAESVGSSWELSDTYSAH